MAKKRYSIKKIGIAIAIVLGLPVGIVFLSMKSSKGLSIEEFPVPELTQTEKAQLKKFGNAYHLTAARKKGLAEPFESKNAFHKNNKALFSDQHLVLVEDNKYYEIPKLLNSLPYLHKDAVAFLDELGERFEQHLNEKGIKPYRFSLTSILRTLDDQKDLRKKNVNATPNSSSHYYGLSFDISQTRFFERGNPEPIYTYRLRNLLLQELLKMQEEEKCYVLLESQTKCIHVTVR